MIHAILQKAPSKRIWRDMNVRMIGIRWGMTYPEAPTKAIRQKQPEPCCGINLPKKSSTQHQRWLGIWMVTAPAETLLQHFSRVRCKGCTDRNQMQATKYYSIDMGGDIYFWAVVRTGLWCLKHWWKVDERAFSCIKHYCDEGLNGSYNKWESFQGVHVSPMALLEEFSVVKSSFWQQTIPYGSLVLSQSS